MSTQATEVLDVFSALYIPAQRKRYAAKAIDAGLAAGTSLVLSEMLPGVGRPIAFAFVLCWCLLCDTVLPFGKAFLHLRVVDAKTGRPCTPFQSLIRNFWLMIVGALGGIVPMAWNVTDWAASKTHIFFAGSLAVSALAIVAVEMQTLRADGRQRRLGDRLAGTAVVNG